MCSCGENSHNVSNKSVSEQVSSSESVYVDPNIVTFPSNYTLDQKLGSKFNMRITYDTGDIHEEINFARYNQYIKYSDSNQGADRNFFVNTGSSGCLFYSKDENGKYSTLTNGEFDINQCYRDAYIGRLASQTYDFSSNEEITYLGRQCIKYTNSEEPTDSLNESLIMDKETGLILHFDLSYLVQNLAHDEWSPTFKFDVKEICFGEDAKSKINQDIENIKVSALDSTMLEKYGFEGELETPHFAINECSTQWQGENLIEYSIEYKERVNSGNDTYINQFETFTTCLYNLGFNKNNTLSAKTYNELVTDSTVDYDADMLFSGYGVKGTSTYKAECHLTVKGGQASIVFKFSPVNA